MQRKGLKIILMFFIVGELFFCSCNRFEEGSISLRSVKLRLSRTWVIESYFKDGIDQTASWNSQYPNYKIVYRLNFTYEAFVGNDSTYSFGTYNLQDWARKIERQPNSSPGTYIVHDILKLSTEELWTTCNGNEEFHFVAEDE